MCVNGCSKANNCQKERKKKASADYASKNVPSPLSRQVIFLMLLCEYRMDIFSSYLPHMPQMTGQSHAYLLQTNSCHNLKMRWVDTHKQISTPLLALAYSCHLTFDSHPYMDVNAGYGKPMLSDFCPDHYCFGSAFVKYQIKGKRPDPSPMRNETL